MRLNSLSANLIFGFGLIILIFAGSTGYAIYKSIQLEKISDNAAEVSTPRAIAISNVMSEIYKSGMYLDRFIITKANINISKHKEAWESIQVQIKKVDATLAAWGETDNKVIYEKIKNSLPNLKAIQDEIEQNVIAGNQAEVIKNLNEKETQLTNEISEFMNELVMRQQAIVIGEVVKTHTTANEVKQIQMIFLVFGLGISCLAGFIISRKITRPFKLAVDAISKISKGDFSLSSNITGLTEMNLLGESITEMVNKLRKIESVATDIAAGDFENVLEIEDQKDNLVIAIAKMVRKLKIIDEMTRKIAEGDYDSKINVENEKDRLSISINNMTKNLKNLTENTKKENWIKTGQMELSDVLRQSEDIDILMKNSIYYLGKYFQAQVAVLYINDENNILQLTASYAHTLRKGVHNKFKFGEGLVGQAALEKTPIIVSDIPEDYIKITSGTGEAIPKSILVYPIVVGKELKGVLEFGSFHEFGENELHLLEKVSENIAMTIKSAQYEQQQKQLLEKTQAQAKLLQAQQEELKVTNEELTEKEHVLKQSQEELKQQSEELQTSNEELEEKTQRLETQKSDIQAKNNALTLKQKEIQEKAKELELSSKYKSEFLANMSHELRTPLNSLMILSDLLLENSDENLTNEQIESLEVINKGGKDLLNLINDILDLSKVEAGKLQANIESVSLAQIIDNMKSQFIPVAEKHGVEFIVETSKDVPDFIYTDSQRVEQVLKNLLSNAFKFTQNGSITLHITRPGNDILFHSGKLQFNNAIGFSVIDTGIGIPESKQKIIFEAFQQVDGTISRKYGGTGLGLAISSRLANLLGGEIHLESQEGKGSKFTLYLSTKSIENILSTDTDAEIVYHPELRDQTSAQLVVSNSKAENIAGIEESSTKSDIKTLLIIDNDSGFSKLIQKVANEKGYESIVIESGTSGIKYAIQHQPTAIIAALDLKDIDSLTLLDQLRRDQKTRHIPILISSYENEKSLSKKIGAIGNILKSSKKEDLEDVFKNIEKIIKNPIKNVLVVEDNKISQHAINKLLSNKQIVVHTVDTGKEALELIKSKAYDCIILDLKLPDMTGLELLKTVSEDESYHTSPIIVYTGKDLSRQEYDEINQYVTSIILKVANSSERLLDEVTLFLHSMNSSMLSSQKNIIKKLLKNDEVLKAKRILLVDDDMRNIYALSTALKKYGLNVTMAANGLKALEKIEEAKSFDLIIMDIMMPEMDGYEAIQRIRKMNAFKDTPILAVTAKAMKGDEEKCISIGANDYITKPVDVGLLVSMMRVWMMKNGQQSKSEPN